MLDAAHLPDDISALKAMLLEREAALQASEARVAHLSAELSTRTAEIKHLKLVLAKLRRMQFGRRSEKLDQQIEQLELKLEDLEAEAAIAEAQAPVEMAPRKKADRKPLPAHPPREERVLRPDLDACPDCGGKLKDLGDDVSEQLEHVPASFRVIRHVRPKLACACCDRIMQAPAAALSGEISSTVKPSLQRPEWVELGRSVGGSTLGAPPLAGGIFTSEAGAFLLQRTTLPQGAKTVMLAQPQANATPLEPTRVVFQAVLPSHSCDTPCRVLSL